MQTLNEIVNTEIAYALAENYEKLNNAKISVIHPDVFIKYSSINVLVGKQGKGKSLTVFKELVKISKLKESASRCNQGLCGSPVNIHMFIYVNKTGRVDETLEALKPLISIPCVYVSVDEVEEYLNNLYFYKMIYDKVVGEWKDKELDDGQKSEIMDFLRLNDFSLPSLQEMILFDDAAYEKILCKTNSAIVKMAHEARHYKFIFCFCVQGIKDIPLPIKEQTTTFFLYSGFMNQKLSPLYQQCGIKTIDFQEFKAIYNSLKEKDYLIIDCQTGGFKIEDNADLTPLINHFRATN